MGFWQTGYMEFHEFTGLTEAYTPPKPVLLRCLKCSKEFIDADALTRHRFEAHPYLQPALLIDGIEFVAMKHMISKKTQADNIRFTNTSRAWFNGEPMLLDALSERIAAVRQGFISVRIKNDVGSIETTYELDVGIPEQDDIVEVEKRFFEFSSVGNLSVQSINNFIHVTRDFNSAKSYVDGLSLYLYGVLAKDQRGGISLTREEGRARMTRAQQLLTGFDTSLSAVVAQTINFNLNAFNDGSSLRNAPRLASAMHFFFSLLHPNDISRPQFSASEEVRSRHVQLDICTDQLIEWSSLSSAELVAKRKILTKTFSDDNWNPDDRLKVQILLAAALNDQGDIKNCSDQARMLRHHPFWGKWAESLILKEN